MKVTLLPFDPDRKPIVVRLFDLAALLEGKTELDGVPICRTSEEQSAAYRVKHLMVYPNGNVMVWLGTGASMWDPSTHISAQPVTHRRDV